MCGRFQFTADDPDERIAAILDMLERTAPGGYTLGEIAPGIAAPGVIAQGEKLAPVPAVFGFSLREGKLLLNARSETAGVKPTFADCLKRQRIVLPADAFFEWDRETREKYRFTVPDLPTFYLGGLYRLEEDRVRFVILTRAANADMAPVHHRMPFILGPGAVRPWLTREEDARKLLAEEGPRLTGEKVS